MMLELEQEGFGQIEILQSIPDYIKPKLNHSSNAIVLKGFAFQGLLQEFGGRGFSVWYSRYWLKAPVRIFAQGGMPFLELRISRKNRISGSWENIYDPELPEHFFQLSFVPYVRSEAFFEVPTEYETFDIHFELEFLEKCGLQYLKLDRFINDILQNKPCEIFEGPKACPKEMIDAMEKILKNKYSATGRKYLLECQVGIILLSALEAGLKEKFPKLILRPADIEALHFVRDLIKASCPKYPGNDELVAKARPSMNAFKLTHGFKKLFGISPFEYSQIIRYEQAIEMLEKGIPVNTVAYRLDYESANSFSKAFRIRFGYPPNTVRHKF
jgi:AraC-like DNA-binding protein